MSSKPGPVRRLRSPTSCSCASTASPSRRWSSRRSPLGPRPGKAGGGRPQLPRPALATPGGGPRVRPPASVRDGSPACRQHPDPARSDRAVRHPGRRDPEPAGPVRARRDPVPFPQDFQNERESFGTDYLDRWSNFPELERLIAPSIAEGGGRSAADRAARGHPVTVPPRDRRARRPGGRARAGGGVSGAGTVDTFCARAITHCRILAIIYQL